MTAHDGSTPARDGAGEELRNENGTPGGTQGSPPADRGSAGGGPGSKPGGESRRRAPADGEPADGGWADGLGGGGTRAWWEHFESRDHAHETAQANPADDASDGIWRAAPERPGREGPARPDVPSGDVPSGLRDDDTAGGRLGRYFGTRWAAAHAVGPGWRPLVARVFDALDELPVPRTLEALVRPPVLVYLEYEAGRLDIILLPTCPVAAEDVRHLRAVLRDVYVESGTTCEACGAPALAAEPRRSTRTHCLPHGLLWAAGVAEAEVWRRA